MKAVILGTEDYHGTMHQVVDTSLRRRVNYVPQRIKPDDSYNLLPPVHPRDLRRADGMMTDFSNHTRITNCNPRSPYLVLVWLLIGSDNEYRTCQYVDDINIHKQVAIILLRLALGDRPVSAVIERLIRNAKDAACFRRDINWVAMAARNAAWVVAQSVSWDYAKGIANVVAIQGTVVARAAIDDNKVADRIRNASRAAISAKAHQWGHVSGEEALQIARQLTFDILSL